ncbi:MAG: hypothetical protein ACYYK0_06750 [Candidatus Eutrophobiaceae bacterium]
MKTLSCSQAKSGFGARAPAPCLKSGIQALGRSCRATAAVFAERHCLRMTVASAILVINKAVYAADLKSLLGRWTENLQGFGPFLVMVFAVLGLICIGMGVHRFINARRRQGSVAEGALYIVSGSLLLSLVAFAGLLSGTSFGSNAASEGLNSLGIG